MKTLKKTLLFIICVLFPYLNYAHDGPRHVSDMQRIYPFDWSNTKIIDFYKLVNNYIDFPNDKNTGKPTPIASNPKYNSMSIGRHRIWYHWGFNKDPRKFRPLIKALNRNIEKGVISEGDVEGFWGCIIKDQKRRNKKLMNEASIIFGYRGYVSKKQRKQLNAFVAILYAIHIIGDHETSDINIILDLKSIYGDVYNAIDDIAGADNKLKANVLKRQLGFKKKQQIDPKMFLDIMESHFSPFLFSLDGSLYNYKKKFEALGYDLK